MAAVTEISEYGSGMGFEGNWIDESSKAYTVAEWPIVDAETVAQGVTVQCVVGKNKYAGIGNYLGTDAECYDNFGGF